MLGQHEKTDCGSSVGLGKIYSRVSPTYTPMFLGKLNKNKIFHGNFFIWIYNNLCNEFNAIFCWDIFFKEKFKIKVYKITFYLYVSKIKSKFPIYSEKLKVNENYISSLSLIFCVSLYLSNSTSTVFGGSDMLHVER